MGIEILAHRGWWEHPEERNTPAALERAFGARMGVETDVRDCAGEIVISHDPPGPIGEQLTLRAMLAAYARADRPGTLALNVKADGLQPAVKAQLEEFGVTRYFLFDMSVPDGLQWVKAGMPIFCRQSDFEPVPALYDMAAGVWMDGFKKDWFGADVVAGHLAAGKLVAIVSPELHERDPAGVWRMLTGFASDNVMLCTDRVADARRFFHGQD